MRKVFIIGGGAAGLMAAYFAALSGAEATIFERNEKTGKKLYITGKGRCNVTNACDIRVFFDKIPTNPKFLMSAVHAFPAAELMKLIESAGVPLKVERGERVFPISDKASDIIRALNTLCRQAGVKVHLNERVTGIKTNGKMVAGIDTEKSTYAADAVIIATGGRSYPLTGSTGDGYILAAGLGHTIIEQRPSLVGLVTRQAGAFKEAQGLSLKNVQLTLLREEKAVYSEQGELLITHFGISGPLVLTASAHVSGKVASHRVLIDMKPALSEEKLAARVLRDFEENRNREVKNVLATLLPQAVILPVLKQAGVAGEKKVNGVTKEERAAVVSAIKAVRMDVLSLGSIEEAVVTRGGVSVKEIDSRTMGSKLIDGLYFAGELIDVDGCTGGFNLQIAFSTGRLAGISAAERTRQ